jgi:hypothetical protein
LEQGEGLATPDLADDDIFGALAKGESSNCRSCFDKALDIMTSLAISYDVGVVQLEYGRCLVKI